MLDRMYNLRAHGHDVATNPHIPWRWVLHWSKKLEADLNQRRLNDMVTTKRR